MGPSNLALQRAQRWLQNAERRRDGFKPNPALGILPIVVTMVVLGRELMAAPWWVWGAFAAACLGLLGLLQLMRRNIGA